MDILLINPPCRTPSFLPLGLGYIASVMRQDGHKVSILDINGFGYSDKEVEQIITARKFDVAGIGGLTSAYKYVKWLAGVIKKHRPDVSIIAGNMVSTASPELLLNNSAVDIAVIDEGELTARELICAIANGGSLSGIKGIYYKENGGIVKNPVRERIADLDSLPFPAWDLFPMDTYLNNSTTTHVSFGMRSINVFTVRGCPYDCTFCSRPFGKRVYRRSAENVVAEVRQLKEKYGANFICFCDDLFLSDQKWAMDVCESLISQRLNVRWSTTGRVNLVNDNLLRKMRRAGCVELCFGFESGSQAILDSMRKHVTVSQAEEAVRITRRAKINVVGSFIIGMPGETTDTIEETLNFIKRTRLPIYRFFYANPYPSTELYDIAKRKGRLPEDEDKYLESLGEMRSTFLVNLTDFPDAELIRLKNLAEQIAKRNLGLKLSLGEFIKNWQRRFAVVGSSLRTGGLMPTFKMIFSRIRHKLSPPKEDQG